ncbi:MAG TPA: hypothetical protein VJS44_16275 [Pyrinomonadaceae bacterium]|nr:hypothetical protein [Pyrinomonadaceae bacterium]
MGLGRPCCNQALSLGTEEADIDALIAAAEEFHRRISVFDSQAKEIRNKVNGSFSEETKRQLKQLQKQKEQIVDEIAASLQRQVSKTGVERIKSHIRTRVKPQIKFTPPQQ